MDDEVCEGRGGHPKSGWSWRLGSVHDVDRAARRGWLANRDMGGGDRGRDAMSWAMRSVSCPCPETAWGRLSLSEVAW